MSKKNKKAASESTGKAASALPPIKPPYLGPPGSQLTSSASAPNLTTGKRRKDLLVKERESSWRIPPSSGIPTYNAEVDPNCPTGQIRKFNDENRMNALAVAEMKKSSQWAKSTIESSFQDVPLKVNISLRTKAMNALVRQNNQDAYAEVEILQKVIVRENLLKELHKLVKTKHDLVTNLSEIVELIKALRYQTVDIIEDISAWQDVQSYAKPFLYKELNYLVKIKCDLDFLDLHEEIIEQFCFEFKSNPLAYRGGGNIITGYESSSIASGNEFRKGYVNGYYDPVESAYVDDIEIVRLHNAEKVIQKEFNRLAKERSHAVKGKQHPQQWDESGVEGQSSLMNLQIDPTNNTLMLHSLQSASPSVEAVGTNESYEGNNRVSFKAGKKVKVNRNSSSEASPNGTGAVQGTNSKVPSQRKQKFERIAVLSDEASEFKSMMAHIEEQIAVLVQQHASSVETRKAYEGKQKEAAAQGRDSTALKIAAEVSVVKADLIEINRRIKELQKESYFIGLERKRKLGTIHQLKEELDETKRREGLKKKIEAKIKKEGLLAALKSFGSNAGDVVELAEEQSTTPKKNKSKKHSQEVQTQEMRPKTPTKHTSGTKKIKSKQQHIADNGVTKDASEVGSNFNNYSPQKYAAQQLQQQQQQLRGPSHHHLTIHEGSEESENDEEELDLEDPSIAVDYDSLYDGQEENYLGQNSFVGRDDENDEEEGEGVDGVDGVDDDINNAPHQTGNVEDGIGFEVDDDEDDELEISGLGMEGAMDFNQQQQQQHHSHRQMLQVEEGADDVDIDPLEDSEDVFEEARDSLLLGDENNDNEVEGGDNRYDLEEGEGQQPSDFLNISGGDDELFGGVRSSNELPPTHHQHYDHNNNDDQSTVFGGFDSPHSQLLQFSVDDSVLSTNSNNFTTVKHSPQKQSSGSHVNYISDSDIEDDVQFQLHHMNARSLEGESPMNSIMEGNDDK